MPAERVCEQAEEDRRDRRRREQSSAHRVDVLPKVRRSAYLAVQRRAPVRPEIEEEQDGNQQHDLAEVERRE